MTPSKEPPSSTTDLPNTQAPSTSEPPPRPLRKACDECHAVKIKCVPLEEDTPRERDSPTTSQICRRCHRLDLPCRFSPADIKTTRHRKKKRRIDAGQAGVPLPAPTQSNSQIFHQAHSPHQQQQPQPLLTQQPQAPFSLNFPNPPLIPDFSSAEWEWWFRELPLGGGGGSSGTGVQQPIPPANVGGFTRNGNGSSAYTPAYSPSSLQTTQSTPSGYQTNGFDLQTPNTAPSSTNSVADADQEALMRAIFGSDPCLSFQASDVAGFAQAFATAAGASAAAATPTSTMPTPVPGPLLSREPSWQSVAGKTESAARDQCPTVKESSSSHAPPVSHASEAHLSIEARLSYLSLEFSETLHQCDPSRGGVSSHENIGGNGGEVVSPRRRTAASHLMKLFARADEVWTEMDSVGADRMKKMYEVLERQSDGHISGGGGEDTSCNDSNDAAALSSSSSSSSVSTRPPLAARYSRSLQGPFTSAGAMLALSLSFQMLDALRLLSKILNSTPSQKALVSMIDSILESFSFDSHPLVDSLQKPMLACLRDHYLGRLIERLDHVINYARVWHHLGEGLGPGPHDSCAVQIQGAKVKGDLEELRMSVVK